MAHETSGASHLLERDRERGRERERDREREKERERETERQKETERDRKRQKETERDRKRQKETERERERESERKSVRELLGNGNAKAFVRDQLDELLCFASSLAHPNWPRLLTCCLLL